MPAHRLHLRPRVLVTGGAGVIGSHPCRRLLGQGRDVLCVDNFYTGAKDNIADLLPDPHFELMRHDITFPRYVEVDAIYNLACPASPIHYQYDPVQTTIDYHRQHGVEIKVARIFNTYGPGMHPNDGRVVSNFIVQALDNRPLTIYGDGSLTRSFCYVDDLVEALVRLMATESDVTGPLNLGNPVEFSMLELARKVIEYTCCTAEPVLEPLPADDPRQRQPDITYARRALGWQPRTSLDDGLLATIAYFRDSKQTREAG